jgi:CHAT domain-containing protein
VTGFLIAGDVAAVRQWMEAGAGTQVQAEPGKEGELLLARAWLAYRDVQFQKALEGGRRAVAVLNQEVSLAPPEALIVGLHMLAELHFDKAEFVDSIGFYQRWAAELLDEQNLPVLRAENQLCLALNQLYHYTFATQVSAARGGQVLLDNASSDHPELRGRLLVAEGLGLKKYADQQDEPERIKLLEQAVGLMDEAVNAFRKAESIRWREAQREKVIIISRFQDRERFERELHPLIVDSTSGVAFGFPLRLRGYYHHRQSAVDSVLYYYQQFRPQAPPFDFHLNDETIWSLIQYAIRDGDLELARRSVRDHMELYGCLDDPGTDYSLTELLAQYPEKIFCYYALCDYGRYRLADYIERGDAQALEGARKTFGHLLDHWDDVFVTGEEESAIRQLFTITHKVIRNATTTEYFAYRRQATTDNANRLLNALERTRTFLLLQDRLQPDEDLRRWQSRINELKERDLRGEGLTTTERDELRRTLDRHLLRSRELREGRMAEDTVRLNRLTSLFELRSGLASSDAILHFGEGEGQLVAQYIDRDTTIAYALPVDLHFSDTVARYLNLLEQDVRLVDGQELRSLSHSLFQRVLGPISRQLSSRGSLLVVAAGPLLRLPFGTLLTDPVADTLSWDQLPYLVDQLTIRYSPSLRIEALNAAARPPRYDNLTVGNWTHPELVAYFKGPVQWLSERAGVGSNLHTGTGCNSSSFMKEVGKFDIINLSVHARGNPQSRYANYLFFAPGDSLNAVTLSRLDCRADLVMLAGCETGRGRTTIAEGTFSIARGFQQLGVPDVVYSLWRVPAAASAELQQHFYEALFAGASPAEALTRAQRVLRREGKYAYPGYWGGMVKG